MRDHFGFQLFLSDKDNQVLSPVIADLQQRFADSPPFSPHLSIYSEIYTDLDSVIQGVDLATQGVKPFSVEAEGYGHEERWSRILNLKIKESAKLNRLHDSLTTIFDTPDSRPFIPHISLMYKDTLISKERDNIVTSLDLPTHYTIQGIDILTSGPNNQNWRDYTKWQIRYHKVFA